MEVIIFFIVLMFAGTIINAFFKGLGAVGDTVTGKGSFKENLDRQFNGIPPFDANLVKGNLFEDGSGPEVQEVYCTGLLPISGKKNLGIVISVFDSTEGEFKPVLSALESYQEANNIVFQNTAVL